ncbi:MAG: radical SAM protein [Magnetococcales bacterium]|nr:radical SAM protein [Magnetococcales bacterium]
MNKYLLNFRYAVRMGKPLLILRLIKTFLGILLLRRRPLRYVDLAIGYSCNLKCEHCFATALEDGRMRRGVPIAQIGNPRKMQPTGSRGRRRLTPTEYAAIAQQAMDLGAVNFSFQGGEPTLYPELPEYIRAVRPERNVVSVTTNGTLLDREKILALRSLGVDILTISLDSADPAIHDAFRGVKGTFDKTLNTIRTALELGLRVTVGAVVTPTSLRTPELQRLIDLVTGMEVILFLALAAPVGEWQENEAIFFTADDRAFLDALTARNSLVRTDFEANFVHYGCGAVKEILYITPFGDVLPCPFLHTALGNLFEEPLQAIRDRALKNPYFADYGPLCLAAEDQAYLARHRKPFYDAEGRVSRYPEGDAGEGS